MIKWDKWFPNEQLQATVNYLLARDDIASPHHNFIGDGRKTPTPSG